MTASPPSPPPHSPPPLWRRWWREVRNSVAMPEHEVLKALQAHLEPGEKVLASVWGWTIPRNPFKSGVLAVTDRRVVRFSKNLFGYDFVTCNFDKIQYVVEENSWFGRRVVLSFVGGYMAFFPTTRGRQKQKLQQVVRIIHQQAEQSGGQQEAEDVSAGSAAERLRRLHALHQEGVLSDDEYAAKKQEVMREL